MHGGKPEKIWALFAFAQTTKMNEEAPAEASMEAHAKMIDGNLAETIDGSTRRDYLRKRGRECTASFT